MSDAELTFDGDLDWLGGAGSPWTALVEGTEFGTVEPLVTALPRMLMDGELVTHDRDENRVIPIILRCDGTDVLDLNEAEADLDRRLRKARSTLRWKPPGMNTPVSVFETFTGSLRQRFDNLGELNARRVYEVTLPALPHARSESESVAPLTLGRRLVDAGNDASKWTPQGTDTVASVDGKIRLRAVELSAGDAIGQMTFAGDRIPLDRGRYISVEVDDMTGLTMKAAATGYSLTSPVASEALSGGRTRYFWGPLSAGFVESLTFQATKASASLPTDFMFDNVYVEATLPSATSRVAFGEVEIGGSVRSPQNVTIESSLLGNVMVFVCQPHNGYRPDLSPYYESSVGGTYTAEASMISGGYWDGGVHTYDVPAVTLRGVAYQVIGHVSGGTPGAGYIHTLTGQLFAANGSTALTEQTTSVKRTVATAAELQFLTLGTLYPPAEVNADSTNIFRITVDAGLVLDEVWLIPMDAELLQVEAGTATRLRVLAPSADHPIGAVLVGTSDADERSAVGKSFGRLGHFETGTNLFWAVTTGAVLDPADIEVRGFKAWHSNAAE